ncbi:hypothetical protein H6P81_006093 [Aristolochia fimbriata]|uniref:Abnormal spindle-like microcephaly-associated protein n=1 Tax=Aristolochia fimbriata TaxID=158543 RepID=A0AAV7EXQ9_ARIFI|nr:hypothetical protein H6P81_006093 [Aristolochia fimbriata]
MFRPSKTHVVPTFPELDNIQPPVMIKTIPATPAVKIVLNIDGLKAESIVLPQEELYSRFSGPCCVFFSKYIDYCRESVQLDHNVPTDVEEDVFHTNSSIRTDGILLSALKRKKFSPSLKNTPMQKKHMANPPKSKSSVSQKKVVDSPITRNSSRLCLRASKQVLRSFEDAPILIDAEIEDSRSRKDHDTPAVLSDVLPEANEEPLLIDDVAHDVWKSFSKCQIIQEQPICLQECIKTARRNITLDISERLKQKF